ncbi:MAG: UDP-N-acetylmuramoyl-tripeptide--D-alanyl-D-alanine ligase [Deltaproteobacteria bacterium]|nr:UDP-N-acetylmuramoyl-tripeptide--D-alanyl-D-alanine ligase [Deltaproteobacteria bacterium]
MIWTREEILLATAGELIFKGKERLFGPVVTDSRLVRKGSVFVALKGERLDGHDFVADAVGRGAGCLVLHSRPEASLAQKASVVLVSDTLKALGDLAHFRRNVVGLKVLAITGSNGKTTTKEMVAAILQRSSIGRTSFRGKVLKTEGNYNNLVGLPLTLLALKGSEKVAVLEMGTNRPGEIKRLTQIAAPEIGLITSVAPAHLEGLKTVEGVAREKGDLFRGMDPKGIAVVNVEDPWVRRLAKEFKGRTITFGRKAEVAAESFRILPAGGIEFSLRAGVERRRVQLNLSGEHNLVNALGAAAMAYGLGINLDAIRRGLEAVKPVPMRMAIEKWNGIGIINDAYNANPASMNAALRTLAGIKAKGKKIAILGDMLEMGQASRKHHLALGRQVARYRIQRLFVIGDQTEAVKKGALMGGMKERQLTTGSDHEAIGKLLRAEAMAGDWLLFKGSRGMQMEKVLTVFKKGRE